MKRALAAVLLLAVALGVGAGGYWLGRRTDGANPHIAAIAPPKPASGSPPEAGSPRKILYYRDPMGLPDTSPVPKKDSMGMDYVPVYSGAGSDGADVVRVNPAKVQELGVQSMPAEPRELTRTIRAVGTIEADERRVFIVNTKFEGWIDKLYVNATGQSVRRGEPLMAVYAPELVVAEQDYLLARQSLQSMAGAGAESRGAARQLAAAALQRLRNWDISAGQLSRLQRSGTVARTLVLEAPADGTVLEKPAVEGMRFMPGESLYKIADLSSVWLIADVFEQDLGALQVGQRATITIDAYPGANFRGRVAFVYPTVSPATRTGKVRIVVPNPDGRLKTGMYANVTLEAPLGTGPVLAVPDSAVINSGTRQTVLIERGAGRYEARPVKLGAHADGYYAILGGLKPGERVVVSANFLIDAESNLQEALKAFAPSGSGNPPPATPARRPIASPKPDGGTGP